MTLTTRLMTFFLVVLGLVLVGFSTTLYLLADRYLNHQVHDRLKGALEVLVASAEVHESGIDWEPQERVLSLGEDTASDQVRWIVHDEHGRILERSRNSVGAQLPDRIEPAAIPNTPAILMTVPGGDDWLVWQTRLQVPDRGGPIPRGRNNEQDHKSPNSPSESEKGPSGAPADEGTLHSSLTMSVGASTATVTALLHQLAAAMIVLSLALWGSAALLGYLLCQRALRPIDAMAGAARSIQASDLDKWLPSPGTKDRLEELSVAFNGLLRRLREAFERQRRFTGDASHQLRTPLTVILGQIEVLLRRDRTLEEYQKVLELVHRQSLNLRQIVEMLLFLARADADARLPDMETLDLREWLQEYENQWKGSERSEDMTFEYEGHQPLYAEVQAPLLGQLLDNLLGNALKYSAAGMPIRVVLKRDKAGIELSVTDQGCGIAEADMSHVFEPFFRTDRVRLQGVDGVGLGLAVAQRIALAFRGTLSVQSELGKGTCLTLHLPVSAVE